MSLRVIQQLFEALNENQIDYCHWKGNLALAQALAGDKDVELLVARDSLTEVITLLTSLGYIQAIETGEEQTPGVFHYYGMDPITGRLAHIHLYASLMTGERFINSHWLPFETMLLRHTTRMGEVRVPCPSTELIIYVLRMFIQYGSLADWLAFTRRQPDHATVIQWLLSQGAMSEALCLLKEYAIPIEESLFLKCVDALQTADGLLTKVILAHQVRWRLRGYERHTLLQRGGLYVQLVGRRIGRQITKTPNRKRLATPGAVIAFVGPEATGKSTLVSTSRSWLGAVFATRQVHAGKPPSSWLTAPINAALPLVRRWAPRLRTTRQDRSVKAAQSQSTSTTVHGLSALLYAMRAVILAWDRRHLLVNSRRWAHQGRIVICDRFPSETIGMMDSPRLRETTTGQGMTRLIYNWLARLERDLYAQIPAPDLALRLTVSIETAIQRNRDRIKVDKEDDAYVETRHRQSRDWSRTGTRQVHDIDTEQPLEDVVFNVKRLVWEALS